MKPQNYCLYFTCVIHACLLAQIHSVASCLPQGSYELSSKQDTAIRKALDKTGK